MRNRQYTLVNCGIQLMKAKDLSGWASSQKRDGQSARPSEFRVIRAGLLALSMAVLVTACGGQREQLIPYRGSMPENVDMTGQWRMQDDLPEMDQRIDSAIRATDGVDERDVLRGMLGQNRSRNGRPSRSRRNAGGLVHVFLESAEHLRITQTDEGLFIAFDRSVVEEYRFGEARTVQTGGARAQRVSGWDGDAYVIDTLDESGMKLSERYRLSRNQSQLTREIDLRSAELVSIRIVQTFARAEQP